MMEISIRDQSILGCRRLLNQLNRDPAMPTYGCFDRRFWAWKMVDFPEATFQRNLKPLCWFMEQPEAASYQDTLLELIRAGLLFTLTLQHKDGSFDQAYPNEHSYGATAFLLPDLISTYTTIKHLCSDDERSVIELHLKSASVFLSERAEQHEFITNHLAGAALALKMSAQLFDDPQFNLKSKAILDSILEKQSFEGWFPEYGGADPGYQTLCMYYLAQIYQLEPSQQLRDALERSLQFLQYFIHPDGTFGGEYGSRRTEVYYPGGIALLASEFPIAASMHEFMKGSIQSGKTVNLLDIDMGNLAPVLSNFALAASINPSQKANHILPLSENDKTQVFYNAGLAAVSKPDYYAILGASTGSVLKVFRKKPGELIHSDCGYLGRTVKGKLFSNQATDLSNRLEREGSTFNSSASFYAITTQSPTPNNYFMLRIANLTIMRIHALNEMIKKMLVGLLIKKKAALPLSLERSVDFRNDSIVVFDKIIKKGRFKIESLVAGLKFSSIHMASARYFTPAQLIGLEKKVIDVNTLNDSKLVIKKTIIDPKNILLSNKK